MYKSYEGCFENIKKLTAEFAQNKIQRNEATTRLHLINRLIYDCLDWTDNECTAEDHYDGEYTDYTCASPRPILIIEAKKEGDYFELPAGSKNREHSIPKLIHDHPNLGNAIKQVANYCQKRGVLLAAVTNGHQIVTFIASRQDTPPLEGRALVFASLEIMSENFIELWNALSRSGIEEKRLEQRLLGKTAPLIPPKLSSGMLDYPGTKSRNAFQTRLKIVSEIVLEDILTAPELEEVFLNECYCESGAISEYSLISKDILNARYNALFPDGEADLNIEPAVGRKGLNPEILAHSISRRPILILGDVGAGKTMFLRRLINIEASDQFKSSITLHLNLGETAALTTDLRVYVVDELYRKLEKDYDINIEELNLIKGIYHLELIKFSKGIYGSFKQSNPQVYLEKEIEFLESKILNRPEHLKSALLHIQKARRKQIILFLDNTDQRNYEIQQEAFLIAQEMASSWPLTVFITLRPETFYLSRRSKNGTLSGYLPKAFTISPPRIDRVLQKRLPFALKITSGEISVPRLEGANLNIRALDNIINAFLDTIETRREIVELIENIAGGNVRLALDIVQSFFGSGHVDTQKIFEIFDEQGSYYIPLHEFLRAVIFGDNVHYDPTRSYIANLLNIHSSDCKEHFLLPILLLHLDSWASTGSHDGFIETGIVYDNLQGIGYLPDQIDNSVMRAHRHKLIETVARKNPESGVANASSIRITSVGAYHLHKLLKTFVYIDAIIIDTPIGDKTTRAKIHNVLKIHERLDRAIIFCDYLDEQWKLMPTKTIFDWTLYSADIRENIDSVRERINRQFY